MGKLFIKRDASIVKPNIVQLLLNPTAEQEDNLEDNANKNRVIAQTKIDGIEVPLIKVNDLTVDFSMVEEFSLYIDQVPKINITINDNSNIIKSLQNPNSDNNLQIQIIPAFDGYYKKINLTFYCVNVEINSNKIYISGIYNINNFYNFNLKSYGEVTTFEMCDKIASELGLGLVSDIDNTTDKRWIYSPSINIPDILRQEGQWGSIDEHPIDIFIDYYDNINIIDIFDTYSKTISLDSIYVCSEQNRNDPNAPEVTPVKITPVITNDAMASSSPLYINTYTPSVQSQSIYEGTDKLICYYNSDNMDKQYFFVEDGSVSNNIFAKYEYSGEIRGSYDYMKQKLMNDKFKQIMGNNTITVRLKSPVFGFIRGGKVNFEWYEYNSAKKGIIEKNDIDTNISITEAEKDFELQNKDNEKPVLNKSISGQYMILNTRFEYSVRTGRLEHILVLGRSQHDAETYIFENNIQNNI